MPYYHPLKKLRMAIERKSRLQRPQIILKDYHNSSDSSQIKTCLFVCFVLRRKTINDHLSNDIVLSLSKINNLN